MKLFLIILLAAVDVALGAAKCDPPGAHTQCFSCLEKGTCTAVSPDVAAGDKCPKGEACKMLSGTATCRPWNQTDCNCGGKNIGCDPISGAIIYCIKNAGVYPGAPCPPPKICKAGQCLDPPPPIVNCTGQVTGFHVSPANCTLGVFCFNDTIVESYVCLSGQYFNQNTGECEAFPTNPCAACNGKCPIFGDCANYAVCVNGIIFDDSEACPTGKYFDPDLKDCSDTEPQACKDYKTCKRPTASG